MFHGALQRINQAFSMGLRGRTALLSCGLKKGSTLSKMRVTCFSDSRSAGGTESSSNAAGETFSQGRLFRLSWLVGLLIFKISAVNLGLPIFRISAARIRDVGHVAMLIAIRRGKMVVWEHTVSSLMAESKKIFLTHVRRVVVTLVQG